jgi:hypothetical protein
MDPPHAIFHSSSFILSSGNGLRKTSELPKRAMDCAAPAPQRRRPRPTRPPRHRNCRCRRLEDRHHRNRRGLNPIRVASTTIRQPADDAIPTPTKAALTTPSAADPMLRSSSTSMTPPSSPSATRNLWSKFSCRAVISIQLPTTISPTRAAADSATRPVSASCENHGDQTRSGEETQSAVHAVEQEVKDGFWPFTEIS